MPLADRTRRAAMRGCTAALVALALALEGSAQELPGSEGPLENDAFLPTAPEAELALELGDAQLVEATTATERVEAFESWREALVTTETGAAVRSDERTTVGVERALRERLRELTPALRREWSARFAPLASEELERAAAVPAALAGVARRSPATPAAALACTRLADLELERGALLEASAWIRRARTHLDLSEGDRAELRAALARREDVLASLELAPPPGVRVPEFGDQWETASDLSFLSRVDFGTRTSSTRTPAPADPGPPLGVRPGLAFLRDGRLAVQARSAVTIVTAKGAAIESSFEPSRLLPDSVEVATRTPYYGPERHEPLRPVAVEGSLILVHGSTLRGRGDGNGLFRILPPSPPPALGVSRPGLPRLEWAVVGDVHVDAEGRRRYEPLLAELGDARFGHGPVVVGATVLAALRVEDSEVKTYLAAFELASGRCRWVRLLSQASGLQPGDDGRGARRPPAPLQPLAALDGLVFVGTNLGAGLVLDALDGRLVFGFRNRRRPAGTRGWRANWPPLGSTTEDGAPRFLWAPVDSDHEYLLSAADSDAVLARPARPIGEAIALVGGDADASLTLSLAGTRRVVSARRARDGARFDSPFLGREEQFGGAAAVSAARVLVATDRGLYLLDRERELYLADYEPLPAARGPAGGDVLARGARVFVVGDASLWTFLAQ